jgi:hypothetical protein
MDVGSWEMEDVNLSRVRLKSFGAKRVSRA